MKKVGLPRFLFCKDANEICKGGLLLTATETKILRALEEAAPDQEVEVVLVEIVGSRRNPTIRVYLDTEGGVSFDELTRAQTWINEVMERIDPFPGAYMLEVSSPGIDRPLRTPEHFSRFAGKTAQIAMVEPIGGRARFTGTIVSADDERVVLAVDGEDMELPYSDMKKAHLKGEIDFNS